MRNIFDTGLLSGGLLREFAGAVAAVTVNSDGGLALLAVSPAFNEIFLGIGDAACLLSSSSASNGEGLSAMLLRVIDSGKSEQGGYRANTKRSYAWFDICATRSTLDGKNVAVIRVLDVSAQKSSRQELLFAEERFRVIYENYNINVWEYNFRTRCILQTPFAQSVHGFDIVVSDVPDSLISCGYVSPESAKSFLEMYSALENGASSASGIFRVKKPDGEGYWYESIQYTNVLDEFGKPFRAIGTSRDVTDEYEIAGIFEHELDYKSTTGKTAFMYAVMNVDDNSVYEAAARFGDEVIPMDGITCHSVFADAAAHVEANDAVRTSLLALDREAFHKFFDSDQKKVSYKFSLIDNTRRRKWVRYEMHLLSEPGTNKLLVFLYCYDIDKQMNVEEECPKNDELTGLLNSKAFISRIDDIIKKSRASAVHALILFDFDNFAQINAKLGRDGGDEIIERFGNLLSGVFYTTDVIARVGGDEFGVFFSNATRDSIAYMMNEFYDMMTQHDFSPDAELCVSAGIALSDEEEDNTAESLLAMANMALKKSKHDHRNGFCFYDDSDM